MKNTAQLVLDRFAIGASILCAIHCVGLPVFLAVFPSLSVLAVDEHTVHEVLVWFVLPSSTLAVFLGCRRHKDRLVFLGALVGLLMIVFTVIYGHDLLGETGEKVGTLLASFILAASHWRNFSLCRKHACGDSNSQC